MTLAQGYSVHFHNLWCSALLLTFSSVASAEVSPEGKIVQAVEQRLTLASHMIQRMPEGTDRQSFAAELETFQSRFLEQIDQLLADDANAFFQRVMVSYRAASVSTKSPDQAREKRRYQEKKQQLNAFHESYEALVEERGQRARAVLDEEKYRARVERAAELAALGKYTEAYALADGANHQMIEALRILRDKETVEYRLEFSSLADEYEYETRRFQSQKMLLQMLVAEKEPSPDTRTLIQSFVDQADSIYRQAGGMAKAGDYEQAVDEQERAVQQLVKAMRVAGVYF
jgi:hypothetical protein